LRLLPYVVPQISTWKRRMLREKDLTDALAWKAKKRLLSSLGSLGL
jgi:hypothetical protein